MLKDSIATRLIDAVTRAPDLGRALDQANMTPGVPGNVEALIGRNPTATGRRLLDLVRNVPSESPLPQQRFIDMVVGPQVTQEQTEREKRDTWMVAKVADACDAINLNAADILWGMLKDPYAANVLALQCDAIRDKALQQGNRRRTIRKTTHMRMG